MKALDAVRLGGPAIVAALTAWLIGRMLWFLQLSVSNALRNDQWPMLEEIRAFNEGRLGWNYLWVPYWGHRIVIPRLILLADERWFHYANAPLIVINVIALCGSAAILMTTAWRLLGRSVTSVTIVSLTVIAGLMLSFIQLENIVYGMAVQNTIAFVSAIASITAMGQNSRGGWVGTAHVSLTVASALVSSLCFGAGLLLWPILVVEGILLQAKPKVLAVIAITGVLVISLYLPGYSNAAMGMGPVGLIRRPLNATLIAAVVLGGTFSNVHVWLGAVVGAFGLLTAIYQLFTVFRKNSSPPPEFLVLVSVLVFIIGCAFSVSAARISPEWLAQHTKPLPGRYLTFAYIFWSSALPLALYNLKHKGWRVISAGAILAACSLLVGFIPAQLDASEQWLRTYRDIDAAVGGFLVGAIDQTHMSQMYPDDLTLAKEVPYLKEHRLSVFAEPRGEWVGRMLTDLYRVDGGISCYAEIELTPVDPLGIVRITGYLKGPIERKLQKTDLVFSNSSGRIAGLGRTLFVNDYRGERFLGYARKNEDLLTAWRVESRRRVCRIEDEREPFGRPGHPKY